MIALAQAETVPESRFEFFLLLEPLGMEDSQLLHAKALSFKI